MKTSRAFQTILPTAIKTIVPASTKSILPASTQSILPLSIQSILPLSIQSILPLSILLLAVVLAGCDTVTPEDTLPLPAKEVVFRFEFSTVGETGGSMQVTSVGSIDLDDHLFAEGYTRADVVAASVRSVEVERVTPVETNLDVFDEIGFTLTSSGSNVSMVAGTDDPPASRTAQLDVMTASVAQVVTAPTFGARLTVVPTIEEDFVLTATVDLRIEVEGI